jgi:hypothetical protein
VKESEREEDEEKKKELSMRRNVVGKEEGRGGREVKESNWVHPQYN